MGSAVLPAVGDVMKGAAQKSADEMRSAQLQQSAEYGRMAADETNANMLDRLNATLGNIDTVRAAGHDDPTSPTAIALHDRATSLNNQERATRVGNINAQNATDLASASYLQSAGSYAMLQGYVSGAGDIAKSLSGTNMGTFGA
jgi:hypothetical protein